MAQIGTTDNTDAAPVDGESLFRRAVSDTPLLATRSKTFPVGVGRVAGFLIIAGGALVVDGLWHGWGDTVNFGTVVALAGVILTWHYLSSRIHFHSTFVAEGSFVSRRWCLMSTVFRYDRIARIEVTHSSYSTSGIALRTDRENLVIRITRPEPKGLRPILIFLSQKVDRSVFDAKALKLMETGELERF